MILLTVMPPNKVPGAVPTTPVGKYIATHLLDSGKGVRVLAPASEAADWPQGVEMIEGAVTDPAVTPHAFQDLEAVCLAGLVGTAPERLRECTNLALKGGAKRVVVLSSHGSDFESEYSSETWQWLAFERALEKHNVEWTYVRPGALFANALVGGYPITGTFWTKYIKARETLYEWSPETAYPFMDESDLASVMAEILLKGGYCGKVVDIIGTMSSTLERLRILSQALGKGILFDQLASEEAARAMWKNRGWPDVTIDVTFYAMKTFAENVEVITPLLEEQQRTAERILGRPTRTYNDWLADHLESFR